MSLRIWCISDTHGCERQLKLPENIDMILFAGDAGTFKGPELNVKGILDFIDWYSSLKVEYKVWIAGNHCTSIEAGLVNAKQLSDEHCLFYLEHETKIIGGLKIFGSPFTPTFHNWAFNVPRHKLDDYWKDIEADTDIVLHHGPPKGILDLTEIDMKTYGSEQCYTQCGDKALLNHIIRVLPKYSVFGHLHREGTCLNAGTFQTNEIGRTKFVNASVVNLQYKVCNNGVIIEI